jgi:hypothetical protein
MSGPLPALLSRPRRSLRRRHTYYHGACDAGCVKSRALVYADHAIAGLRVAAPSLRCIGQVARIGRPAFSLDFELENVSTGERVQFLTPLDANGQTAHARAVAPKERIIDLSLGRF